MVEQPAYLEFRIPSGLDDDFNVYKNTAKLDYISRKPKTTRTHRSSEKTNPVLSSAESARGSNHLIFFKNAETPVNVAKFPYSGKTSLKSGPSYPQKQTRVKERVSLPNGEIFSGKVGNDIAAYKFISRPVLKAYPGKDPGNLKVTTNSRSATLMSADFFELAPNSSDHVSGEAASNSQSKSVKSARIGVTSSGDLNSSSEIGYALYPLQQHSYKTSQPPWVNKIKLRRSKEHVTQIMSQKPPINTYSFSPVPPANSTEPPLDDETKEEVSHRENSITK